MYITGLRSEKVFANEITRFSNVKYTNNAIDFPNFTNNFLIDLNNAKVKERLPYSCDSTCMPEIMSQNIFPKMREDCDVPILPLIMDEQTGKAGYITRLEAFVDLMRRRKRKLAVENKKQAQLTK